MDRKSPESIVMDSRLPGFLGLAILVIALSLAGTACKPSMRGQGRQVCTIDTDGALKLNCDSGFGGLVVNSIISSASNRERIEVNGPIGDIEKKNGIYEIRAFDETAVVYVDQTRAITLTGNIGRELDLTNHHGPLNISANVDHISILNQQGDMQLSKVHGSVSITNLKGNLVAEVGGNLDLLNHENGDTSLTAFGNVHASNLAGNTNITAYKDVSILNQKDGDTSLVAFGDVHASNLAGNSSITAYGDVSILNQKNGDTSLTAFGNVHASNLAGNSNITAYKDVSILNQDDGNCSITAYGDVSIRNFGQNLEEGTRFGLLMKNRPIVERVLKEQGHSLQIQASGFGVIKLGNIDAQRIEVRGWGLNILNVFALETTLRMADNCALQNIQSPLKMSDCSNSSLNGLEMDYSLENCTRMQVNPRDELGPHGTLKDCQNIIFWNTPADRVSQIGCQQVIFARQTPPATTGG